MPKVSFMTSERNKKIALWLLVDGQQQNIWDIQKRCVTPEVLRAVQSAFELGIRYALKESETALRRVELYWDRDWEDLNGNKQP